MHKKAYARRRRSSNDNSMKTKGLEER